MAGRSWASDVRLPVNRLSIATLLAAALLAGSTTAAAPAADPYEINVVISTTGSGAFLGTQEQASLGVLEKVVNAGGGIKGRPIRFVIQDDQTNPAVSVQLTNALIERRVPVILGSALAATCSAMAALVEKNGPLEYCFSPIIRGAPGSYVFSASAGSDAIAAVLLRFFRENGWTRIALITSTDASGVDFERQFDGAIAQNENKNVQLIDREHFNPTDISVAAQMAHIKAANPQGVITFATGTPLGTLLRGFHDAGMTVPISASGGNMIYAQMAQYAGFMPSQLYFAATRGVVPDPSLGNGPIKDAQNVYFRAFAAAGIRPDFATSLAWDPTMLVVGALRQLGTDATAERLHAYIEALHGWGGIDGLYDFRDNSQRGIGPNAMIVYHWSIGAGTFEVASRPAGRRK
jgi:branched-chain amino acid transport system substrate-binding protein